MKRRHAGLGRRMSDGSVGRLYVGKQISSPAELLKNASMVTVVGAHFGRSLM
jgi:hypothetical protein